MYDNHPGDIASETLEREKDYALGNNIDRELAEIDNALESIKNGTYGICKNCGKKIDVDRLKALPETDLCLDCSEKLKANNKDFRPIEEEAITDAHRNDSNYEEKETAYIVSKWNEHAGKSKSGAYSGESISEKQ